LQLPLIFEAICAAVVSVTSGSPFDELERTTGRWLPHLRLGSAVAFTILSTGALAAGGASAHLAGGVLDVLRNTAGLIGVGLICAAVFGAGLAWIAPVVYLVLGVYALYTVWHGPAL
jgi:hypothetical protein